MIEYDDAKKVTEGQKLTFYRWGNSQVTSVEKEGDEVKKICVRMTPEDKVFKNTTIVHWVPMAEGKTTKVSLVEFDHLISVRKIEENMKVEDVVTPVSRVETPALVESAISNCKQGDVVQLERRGYFYIDSLATETTPIQLHFVPDGKLKNQSAIETKINVKSLSKGEGENESKKKQDKKNKKEKEKEKKKQKEGEKSAEVKEEKPADK